MTNEVFFDTSGFFMLMDERDALHQKAVEWLRSHRGQVRPVTTEWVVGETCTLLVARKRPHLVTKFLDYLDRSAALLLINPDETLLRSAKAMIRRQAEQGILVCGLPQLLSDERTENRRSINHGCTFPEGRLHSRAGVKRLSRHLRRFHTRLAT